MGFGREKTVYIYFAVASCPSLPYMMRLVIAKAAIIVTVADDFYDMEGTLPDLEILTHAVQRYSSIIGNELTCSLNQHSLIRYIFVDGMVKD